jgi:hypothetical protein
LGPLLPPPFSSCKFIDKQTMLSQKEKYDYAKLLRAQLSTAKYNLIKNIPLDYFTTSPFMTNTKIISPKETYPSIKFEYEE